RCFPSSFRTPPDVLPAMPSGTPHEPSLSLVPRPGLSIPTPPPGRPLIETLPRPTTPPPVRPGQGIPLPSIRQPYNLTPPHLPRQPFDRSDGARFSGSAATPGFGEPPSLSERAPGVKSPEDEAD